MCKVLFPIHFFERVYVTVCFCVRAVHIQFETLKCISFLRQQLREHRGARMEFIYCIAHVENRKTLHFVLTRNLKDLHCMRHTIFNAREHIILFHLVVSVGVCMCMCRFGCFLQIYFVERKAFLCCRALTHTRVYTKLSN